MDDTALVNANIATMAGGAPYGAILDGVIAVQGDRVAWVGPRREWRGRAREERDARGAWITPALVDCHTHLVYAGTRSREFELRLQGATYEEIARSGGGILSTVRHTRAASEDDLAASARKRIQQWRQEGATLVEIKSGYGLNLDTELKMLRAARRLADELDVRTTFLGAHTVPPEFAGRSDEYVDLICEEMLPAVARERLADAVDVFCERIGFNVEQTRTVLAKARELGLPVKLHADQLSDLGGAQLAAEHGALSADHIEYSSEGSIRALASAGTVAVLLPGAFYFLREQRLPPIDALRRYAVPIAIATDHNPGSSPLSSPLLAMNLAATLWRLTPEETLAGMTRNAARALGEQAMYGTLEPGKRADFAFWEVESPAELAYAIGANPCVGLVRGGRSAQ